MQIKTIKDRDVTFDVMKGIGIILVVLGHVIEMDYFPIKKAIFTFHMPFFLYWQVILTLYSRFFMQNMLRSLL